MSVVVMVKCSDGVVIAADGITYDDEGIMRGTTSKIEPIMNLNCVLTQVGAGGLSLALRLAMGNKYRSFDDLLMGVADDLRAATEAYQTLTAWVGGSPNSTVALAGWSDEREQYELYRISNWEKADVGLDVMPAYELVPVDFFWSNTLPPDDAFNRYDINVDAVSRDAMMAARRYVCACRLVSRGRDEDGGIEAFGCGAFLQTAVFQKGAFSTSIDHHWPDEVGKPIDPSIGELVPDWMMPKDEPSAAAVGVAAGSN